MKRLVPIIFCLATAQAATCTPPTNMMNGRVPASPLLKFDCAKTQDLIDRYKNEPYKPTWVEVFTGKEDIETAKATTPIFKALRDEGYSVDSKEHDKTSSLYTFKKGNIARGGHIFIMSVILSGGKYILAMVQR